LSEEEEQPKEENSPEEVLPEDFCSPLQTVLTEIHEVYVELVKVGFEEKIASAVIAHMIQDAMMYRDIDNEDEDDDDEEYFNDELNDESDDNDRGTG
jgi:hypothetical protein